MSGDAHLTRRELLPILAGPGLFVVFSVESLLGQETERLAPRPGHPTDFNAYLRIGEDGRTTCTVGKVELGQGAMTSLAQICAEELDVPFETVDVIMGDTALCPWDMGTFGSLTIRSFGPVLRAAVAEARAVLKELAAESLKVSTEHLVTKDGAVVDARDSGRRVSFAELVKGKRIERHLQKVPVKPA